MSALADVWTQEDAGGPGQLSRGGAAEPPARGRTGRWRTCDALDRTTLRRGKGSRRLCLKQSPVNCQHIELLLSF